MIYDYKRSLQTHVHSCRHVYPAWQNKTVKTSCSIFFIQPLILSFSCLACFSSVWSSIIQPCIRPTNRCQWGTTDKWPIQISTQHPANDFYSGIGTELTTWTLYCHFQKTDGKRTVDLPFMVVVYEGRHGADLDGVRVIGWILKQAVVRVEELSGDEEEKLSGGSAVVQPAGRMNHESTTTQSSALKTQDDTTLWWQRMSCDSFYRLQKHAVDAVNHLSCLFT